VVGDPLEEEVGGQEERWAELLARHTARVDLPNGE